VAEWRGSYPVVITSFRRRSVGARKLEYWPVHRAYLERPRLGASRDQRRADRAQRHRFLRGPLRGAAARQDRYAPGRSCGDGPLLHQDRFTRDRGDPAVAMVGPLALRRGRICSRKTHALGGHGFQALRCAARPGIGRYHVRFGRSPRRHARHPQRTHRAIWLAHELYHPGMRIRSPDASVNAAVPARSRAIVGTAAKLGVPGGQHREGPEPEDSGP
jgi:hypothetical protein